jgi:Notch-like protein
MTCDQVGALVDSSGTPLDPATAACAVHAPIAGYYPGSDVIQHNAIDLDQKAMETELSSYDFPGATEWYAVGGNSLSKGSFRTLKGFSTGAEAKMYNGCPGCPYATYSQFYEYYEDFDYADKWVSAALAGTSMSFSSGKHGPNDFSTLGNAARVEAVKKGTAYMNVWMYVIREFEDAIDDCSSCTANCNEFSINSGSVHAWDEGVAFYTGSLEGELEGGSSSGKLVYRLAEKRCKNFGTCGLKT